MIDTEASLVKRAQLGSTDLEISRLGFGCSRLGGMNAAGKARAESIRLVHAALDRGINFFDTADAYAHGDSERLLGEALVGKRQQVVLATKGGYLFSEQPVSAGRLGPALGMLQRVRSKVTAKLSGFQQFTRQDFSARYLTEALEGSLRRLRTDYVDLYQLHAPRAAQAESSDAFAALLKLRDAGKIRYLGVGLESLDALERWLEHEALDVIQLPFGLLDLEASTNGLPAVTARGVGLIARGIFGGGLLRDSLPPERLRQLTPKWQRVEAFHEIARDAGRTVYELALHYVLQHPGVSAVLLGMHTQGHLDANLRHLRTPPLESVTLRAVEQVNERVPLVL